MNRLPIIDYKLASKAIDYYISLGYKYMEVPWVVGMNAYAVTSPRNAQVSIRKPENFIASGEQGFLELLFQGNKLRGKYVCCSPCYRPGDDGKSPNHYKQFFKVELGVFRDYYPEAFEYADVVGDVFEFILRICPGSYCEETQDEPRLCESYVSHDIFSPDGIELASCGIRYIREIGYWIYATGAALPRLLERKH